MQLNQAQYAKYKGITRQAVHDAVKHGRLVLGPDRKIQVEQSPAKPVAAAVGLPSLAVSKQARAAYEAKQAEIEYRRQAGLVVERTEVSRTFHAIGRMFSAAREAIPAQIAPRLVGKTDLLEIEMVLKAALRDGDTRIADEIESRFLEITGGSGGSDANG